MHWKGKEEAHAHFLRHKYEESEEEEEEEDRRVWTWNACKYERRVHDNRRSKSIDEATIRSTLWCVVFLGTIRDSCSVEESASKSIMEEIRISSSVSHQTKFNLSSHSLSSFLLFEKVWSSSFSFRSCSVTRPSLCSTDSSNLIRLDSTWLDQTQKYETQSDSSERYHLFNSI